MPNAKELLNIKGWGGVVTIVPGATILEACRVMADRRVGSLIVSEGDTVLGIITEKDVVIRVVAGEKDPTTTLVREMMTEKVICVKPDRPLDEVEAIMRQERVRHVPVVEEKALLGIISIGDVTAWHADKDRQQVEYLTSYILGR